MGETEELEPVKVRERVTIRKYDGSGPTAEDPKEPVEEVVIEGPERVVLRPRGPA